MIIGFLLLPLDLDQTQHTLAAILLGVVALWITEAVPIPVGGLIGIALIVFLGVGDADTVLAPFGSSTVFTFIGAFIIAQAMLRHGLARRFAFRMLAIRGVSKSTARTIIAFGLITAVLSAFVSNTATVAMLLPTAIAILATLTNLMNKDRPAGAERERFDPLKLRVGVALMLMLAYGASVGGLLTPVGSPPNLIGRQAIENATGEPISFFEWMLSALPICAVMFVILAVILLLLNRPEVKRLEGVDEYVAEERRKLGSMSQKEKNTLIAFATAVTLWIAPGIVGIIAGDDSKAYDEVVIHLDEGIVAIFAASLLFLLPTDWRRLEFTLPWSEAVQIDWWIVFLYGGGIALGTLAFETGLAEALGRGLTSVLGVQSAFGLLLLSTALATVLSETTSNTASANMVVPVVIAFARSAGIDPLLPAVGATMGASLGFMLPVSTPCNAIVYGSGVVPITKMIKNGFVFDVRRGRIWSGVRPCRATTASRRGSREADSDPSREGHRFTTTRPSSAPAAACRIRPWSRPTSDIVGAVSR